MKVDRLNEFGELKAAGAVAVSDDGRPVKNAQLMRRALEYAAGFGLKVISHCEELDLVQGGVMNEGPQATRMGLGGIPNARPRVSWSMRDIALAALTGVAVHIAHVSTRQSVQAIARAKADGVAVTAETAPHYFTLTDADVAGYNTHAKMNPPLRSEADRRGGAPGTGRRHPRCHRHRSRPPFHPGKGGGVRSGRQRHCRPGDRSGPGAAIGGRRGAGCRHPDPAHGAGTGRLSGPCQGGPPGMPADLTLIDPDLSWTVDPAAFQSKGRNTPFEGRRLKGKAVMTIVDGRIVYDTAWHGTA